MLTSILCIVFSDFPRLLLPDRLILQFPTSSELSGRMPFQKLPSNLLMRQADPRSMMQWSLMILLHSDLCGFRQQKNACVLVELLYNSAFSSQEEDEDELNDFSQWHGVPLCQHSKAIHKSLSFSSFFPWREALFCILISGHLLGSLFREQPTAKRLNWRRECGRSVLIKGPDTSQSIFRQSDSDWTFWLDPKYQCPTWKGCWWASRIRQHLRVANSSAGRQCHVTVILFNMWSRGRLFCDQDDDDDGEGGAM